MARKFQIKRGLKANLPKLAQGEFAMTTDSGNEGLYLGTGNGNLEVPIPKNGALRISGSEAESILGLDADRAYLNVYEPNGWDTRRTLMLHGAKNSPNVKDALTLSEVEDGRWKDYPVLHTGNYSGYAVEVQKNLTPESVGYDTLLRYMESRDNDHAVVYANVSGFSDMPTGVTSAQAVLNMMDGILTATLHTRTAVYTRGTNSLSSWTGEWRKVYDESNKPTAADVGALPRDGSVAMTTLNFQSFNNGYGRITKSHSETADYGTSMRDYDKTGNFLTLGVRANTGNAFVSGPDGAAKVILHTGNKPSGSYTGNGSAAIRDIGEGTGIGNAVIVYSEKGIVIITPLGAFAAHASGASSFTGEAYMHLPLNGRFRIATASEYLNALGVEYTYYFL